jgi:hypothetical protein
MNNRAIILGIIAAVALSGSAAILFPTPSPDGYAQKAREAVKVQETKETIVVINEEKPQGPPVKLKFVEDLAITQEAWTPGELGVDDDGNVYVIDGTEWALKKFNSCGVEVSRKPFRKGQGPGEFQMIDAHYSADGLFYLYDAPQRRLTILDKSYEIRDIQKTNFWGIVFRMDSRRNIIALDVRFLPATTDRQRLVLTKHAPTGEILFEMGEYLWGLTYDGAKRKYQTDLFRPQIKYKIDSHDNIYYAISDKYEINVVSPEGKLVRKIAKKGSSRKVTQKDVDLKMEFYPLASRARYEFLYSPRMPCLADLFSLENGWILAVTFESDPEADNLAGDVFDDKGIYRGRVQVPRYAAWDDLVVPRRGQAVLKGSCFYAVASDEAEEKYFVKRYKLVWE